MRVLRFPGMNFGDVRDEARDWTQQEVADFYRAHRLLVENGVAIGLDRGTSDIGEPWMVFFDLSSQDVFLHVARIQNRCHLICEPLNLRISAANVATLITDFEDQVRNYLSIRSERAKNVVIHPAARIIMSITAIFLLFKLENGEAQAKELAEKNAGAGVDASAARVSDKAGGAFVRAQAAFNRAFDSFDAPTAAALFAGFILASELDQSSDILSKLSKAVMPASDAHAVDTAPMIVAHGDELMRDNGHPDTADAVAPAPNMPHDQEGETVVARLDLKLQDFAIDIPVEPAEVAVVDKVVATNISTDDRNLTPPAEIVALADIDIKTTAEEETAASVAAKPDSLKALEQLMGSKITTLIPDELEDVPAEKAPAIPGNQIGAIHVANLDEIDDKVGFFMKTQLHDGPFQALMTYFLDKMGEMEIGYASTGKVLVEQKNTEALLDKDIGMWTNVMPDGTTFTVVGRADLIDDIVSWVA